MGYTIYCTCLDVHGIHNTARQEKHETVFVKQCLKKHAVKACDSYTPHSVSFLGNKAKRVIIFPVVFSAISVIINIGSMAAIGYLSNDTTLTTWSQPCT